MIRLTNNQARTVAAQLILSELFGDLARRVAQKYQRGEISAPIYTALANPDTGDVPQESFEEILNGMIRSLQDDRRNNSQEVIEVIINAISQPMAANMMASEWLRELRLRLLSADERVKIEQVTDKFLRCNSCGHSFDVEGEEAVILDDGSAVQLKCRACMKPRLTACATRGCQESVPWNPKKHPRCAECQKKMDDAMKADKGKSQVTYQQFVAGAAPPLEPIRWTTIEEDMDFVNPFLDGDGDEPL